LEQPERLAQPNLIQRVRDGHHGEERYHGNDGGPLKALHGAHVAVWHARMLTESTGAAAEVVTAFVRATRR
jgi:hypothetical protein